MAQVVKLKRTAVQGKVPAISNVELGELAINTYDGRIFFEKSSSAESIQEILTTNSGRAITGSLNLSAAITASHFRGDGSALTNVNATISEQATVTSSFDDESTINVAHNFSSKNVIVSVYDNNDNQIIPQTVSLTSVDNVRVVLSSAQSGFVVVAKGGHVVSGSADDSNKLNGQLASYYLNYNNFTNVPSGLVSGSGQITLSSTTGYNANEHFTQANITTVGTVTSGNINAILPDGVISGSSQLTSTFDSRYLNTNGDDVVSGSVLRTLNGTGVLSGSITSQLPSGTVSGSDQVASTFAQTILDDTSAGAVRTTIGVDAAGTDNSTDVTLTGTPNYITISGQVITRNTIDIGDDTNLTAGTGITLTGDTLSTTDSEIVHDNLSGFVANEHIDHSTITVGSGKGLQGGGTIDTSRSLSLHTGSAHFSDGVVESLPSGVISGSSQVNANSITNFDSNVKSKLDADGVISGSSQVSLSATDGNGDNIFLTDDLSEGSSNLYYTDTRVKTKLNSDGVVSGSSQINSLFIGTAVSTSIDDRLDTLEGESHENPLTFSDTAQVDLIRTTNTITANLKGGVISGSAQVNDAFIGTAVSTSLDSRIDSLETDSHTHTNKSNLDSINQDLNTTDNVQFGDLLLSGDLTVQGTTVTLNTAELNIEDKLISVASGSTTSAQADGAGLHISGADESITWDHGNSRFNISDDVYAVGTIKASSDIVAYASSDIELKNNIKPIENPLEKINQISGNSFVWNEEKQNIYKGKDYGVIAQEIEEILPELVQTRQDGYKAVKYDKLVSLLIEGIKHLNNEVNELKGKIK